MIEIKIFEYTPEWALGFAIMNAKNSHCKSKRGVVIWDRYNGIVGSGWNAPPYPFSCDGSDTCRANCAKTAVHAEQAALMDALGKELDLSQCEMIHVKVVDGKAVTSEKPSCWQCSKLILASGIKSMWLFQEEGLVEYTAEDFHNKTLINCDLK